MDDAVLIASLADTLSWALDAKRDYHIGAARTVEWAMAEDERTRRARELVEVARARQRVTAA